jgi:hypothetical protein
LPEGIRKNERKAALVVTLKHHLLTLDKLDGLELSQMFWSTKFRAKLYKNRRWSPGNVDQEKRHDIMIAGSNSESECHF